MLKFGNIVLTNNDNWLNIDKPSFMNDPYGRATFSN